MRKTSLKNAKQTEPDAAEVEVDPGVQALVSVGLAESTEAREAHVQERLRA